MNSSLLPLLLHRGDAGTVSPGGTAAWTSGQQIAAQGKGKEPGRRCLGSHRPHLKVQEPATYLRQGKGTVKRRYKKTETRKRAS